MINDIIKKGTFPPVLLLFGAEDYMVEMDAKRLYEAASKLDATGMNCDVLDGEQTSLDTVLSLARSYPMMSDLRVIWVRRAEKMSAPKGKKSADAIMQYFKEPSASTFLLLTATLPAADGIGAQITRNAASAAKKIAALKQPFPAILRSASWSEYPLLKEPQAAIWINKKAAELGIELPQRGPEVFISRCGTSLRDISMELEKLAAYLGDRTQAQEEDIHTSVGSSREYNVFELQRALGRGDQVAATRIVTNMLQVDSQELAMISMLSRFFQQLFKLADARSLTDQSEISKLTGIPTWALSEQFTVLDTLGVRRVERAIHILRECERTLKSTSTDSLLVLQSMISRILDNN